MEEVVGYRTLAGSRLFFSILSGLPVPDVFLRRSETGVGERRGERKKIVRKRGGVR